ncbi:MAG: FAD-dependent oxidoreductase [Candidatus Nomurabacteria bacterium]|nr:FAD-dependent oxidoreductase [Candidatus Nomurabacteria bacterium]
MIYDLIILGGGPAGTSAAVYAARKRLKTLFITAEFGGQSTVSEKIYNWIGSPEIGGMELGENFKKHIMANAGDYLEVKEGQKALNVSKNENIFTVKTDANQEYQAKTILISTGSGRRKLVAKNADTLEHKGITYCASCDGPLFSGADVVVIGGGNAGFESAAQLLAYCNSVTLINRSDTFRADEITVEKVLSNPKMKAIKNADILEVKGEKFVEGLIYQNRITKETKELPVTGIFVEIGQIPNTDIVKGLVDLDDVNRVKIDPWTNRTSVAGIWAAGDCTNILYHQNNIAAGDGVKALEDIYLYIHAK